MQLVNIGARKTKVACLIFLFFANIFSHAVTYIQVIWVCAISLVVYWAIVFTLTYYDSKNKLKWISAISEQFVHMQIFLDNNTLVIEILEGELENLEQAARIRGFKIERISEHNGIVKVIVK